MVAGILADLNRWHDWWVNTVFSPKQMTINQNTNGTLGPILPPILSSGTKSSTSAKKREYAVGTDNAEGGPSLVGELGPEIRNLKKGDTITTAAETAKILSAKPTDQTKKYKIVGSQITTGLLDGINNGTPKLLSNMTSMSNGIMSNLTQGIADKTKDTIAKTTTLSNGVTKVFTDLSKSSNPAGNSIISALSTGMKNTASLLNNTTTALSNGTKTTFNKLATDSNPIGKNVSQGLSDGIKSNTNNVTGMVKTLTDKVILAFQTGFDIHSPSKKLVTIGSQVGQGFINGVKAKDLSGFITKQMGSMMKSFSGNAGSAQLNAWIMEALGITGTSMSWLPALQQLIQFESGGDPNNINLTDSNAKAGHPSQGLMQTIPSTFAQFAKAGLGGITNPIANIVAGIGYIKSRYGTIFNTPGIKSVAHGGPYMGYLNGTNFASKGWKWVGENGPELMNFNGGEKVKNTQDSMELASNSNSTVINFNGSYTFMNKDNIDYFMNQAAKIIQRRKG